MSLRFAMVFVFALAGVASAAEPAKVRVLIIDGQNNHNWRATSPVVKKILEDSGRFTVAVATAPDRPKAAKKKTDKAPSDEEKAAVEKARLKYAEDFAAYSKEFEKFAPDFDNADVVVSNYNGALWPESVRKALETKLSEGKLGLVVFHGANNSFPDWAEFNRMIGMGWRGNQAGDRMYLDADGKPVRVAKGQGQGAGEARSHEFVVTVRDADHPVMRGLPKEFKHTSDQLVHGLRGPAENVTVLATAWSDKAKGGTGLHELMVWTVAYGKGRVFHTPMGHDNTSIRCVGFATLLLRGTEWAAGGSVTIPVPATFPAADQTRSLPMN